VRTRCLWYRCHDACDRTSRRPSWKDDGSPHLSCVWSQVEGSGL